MKIDVKNLLNKEVGEIEEGGFRLPLKLEELELIELLEGKYRLIRLEKSIIGHFYIRVTAKISCSRCLSDFDFLIDTEFDREFSQLSGKESLSIKDFSINIDELLREEILLSFPVKPLCNEACKGLCPSCGKNLNVEGCVCGKSSKSLKGKARID
jgi:uncharacterized protein